MGGIAVKRRVHAMQRCTLFEFLAKAAAAAAVVGGGRWRVFSCLRKVRACGMVGERCRSTCSCLRQVRACSYWLP